MMTSMSAGDVTNDRLDEIRSSTSAIVCGSVPGITVNDCVAGAYPVRDALTV
jgi:hypothetical protein